MTFEFLPTLADLSDYKRAYRRHKTSILQLYRHAGLALPKPTTTQKLAFIFCAVLIVTALVSTSALSLLHSIAWAVPAIITLLFIIVLIKGPVRDPEFDRYREHLAGQPSAARHRITLTSDSFEYTCPAYRVKVLNAAIAGALEIGQAVAVFDAKQVHIIPLRAFPDPQTLAQFIQQINAQAVAARAAKQPALL